MATAPAPSRAAPPDGPRLVADIGGTHARFGLAQAGGIEAVQVLRCADYPGPVEAVQAYFGPAGIAGVRHAAMAIATAIEGDRIHMTNHEWDFSIEATRRALGLETLMAVNDFTALAMALPCLQDAERMQVGGGQARPGQPIGLVGAGTGLGVSGLIPSAAGWVPLASEGGHASFAPGDAREVAILDFAWKRHAHVSFERLVSGPGMELIYAALATRGGVTGALAAPDIVQRALEGADTVCRETVDVFCGLLGSFAGNVALTLGAHGGLYVGGGIVPRLGELFARSPFRERFEAKGRFHDYLAAIPTYVITAPMPALTGVAAMLEARLAAR